MLHDRRAFLGGFLTASAIAVAPTTASSQSLTAPLPLTPQCDDGDSPTISQTEGPFFKTDSPERHDLLADGLQGERITVAGFVLDRDCRPIPGALVELWHADGAGRYDNEGYRCRGHQMTDANGRWWFTTIVPARYPGRTRHYHVKAQRPAGRVLTTQLYFPGEPQNRTDWIFDERLLMDVRPATDGRFGRFDIIL